MGNKRSFQPAIYNQRRLFEQPIPMLEIDVSTDGYEPDHVFEEVVGNTNASPNVNLNESNQQLDPLNQELDLPNQQLSPPKRSPSQPQPQPEIKMEPLLIRRISISNNERIYILFEEQNSSLRASLESEIQLTTDVIDQEEHESMSYTHFPMPKREILDSRMIKREDDSISGNKCYFEPVSKILLIIR